MSDTNLFLPVGCFTVVIKRSALNRSYPGGVQGFEATYDYLASDANFYRMGVLSRAALDHLLQALEQAGLISGEDLAVADRLRQPIVECPDIRFQHHQHAGQVKVHLLHNPTPKPRTRLLLDFGDFLPWPGIVGLDSRGCVTFQLQDLDGMVAIDAREAFGAVDSWDEYLCAWRGPWGYILDVCRYQWLGELPEDWFDEAGEPKPERTDTNGNLRLPDVCDHSEVLGQAYGGLIGPLEQSFGGPGVQISDWSGPMVEAALQALGWRTSCAPQVQKALQQLDMSPHSGTQRQQVGSSPPLQPTPPQAALSER